MLFSSITFLYYFLPVVMILYLAVPTGLKNYVLLLASLFFYAWGEPKYILLMAVTILLGFGSGLAMESVRGNGRKKALMVVSVSLCLGVLGIFKYADFFIDSFNTVAGQEIPFLKLALPIGISFYTFQLISYIIDVYRGSIRAQRDPVRLAVYICMFPQLIAGPIVRYVDVEDKLGSRSITLDRFSYGISRFCMGLGKKVLLANVLGELCAVYKGLDQPTILFTWMYGMATTLQLYFDFSGYSDMAIGLGTMLGFDFPENFLHPLVAKSATEFWRRWHVTLGSWFRDYLYIPLGGNRVSKLRHLLNILIVWMATGLWHGASWNFVIWGIYFAILLVIEKYGLLKLLNRYALLGHIYLLANVLVSFIIFDNTLLSEGLSRIGYLVGIGGIPFASSATLFYLKDYGLVLLLACIGATELPGKVVAGFTSSAWSKNQDTETEALSRSQDQQHKNGAMSWTQIHQGKNESRAWLCGIKTLSDFIQPLFNVILLLLSTAFLVNGTFNPFLYFRF